jgi:hypothetical protein
MKKVMFWMLVCAVVDVASASSSLDNVTCQKCHPKIYEEYENSAHKNASIYNDPIHKAVWDRHPAKKKGHYRCAKCHSPADKSLQEKGATLVENPTQRQEPISCLSCHQIKDIKHAKKSNTNIYTDKKKLFFATDASKKGTVLRYHDKSTFFGLFKTRVGSPYHDIDYGNENFYNAKVCLGCHDHKENGLEFAVCDMQIKEDNRSKENCITCHMPQVKGPFVNLNSSDTHTYHGRSALTPKPTKLAKHILLSLQKEQGGFTIMIENKANHTLLSQPLRVGKLKVTRLRGTEKTVLDEVIFRRVIGHEGKPSMPWLATEVLKDTLLKAFEKRKIHYHDKLEKGDTLEVVFGYHIIAPEMAEKWDIEKKMADFIILKKARFTP